MTPVVRASAPFRPLAPGVTVAEMLNDAHGCHGLHQRRIHLAGSPSLTDSQSLAGTAGGAGEAWYVLRGTGRLEPDVSLRPGTAVWLPAATGYRCEASADGMEILAVTVRAGAGDDGPPLHVVCLEECEPERTGDREFRVLLSAGLTFTQFVGHIPPGRAPSHHHTYDEVVHVLAGHGVVHLAGGDTEIGPGTSIYLPPLQPHCLENTGPDVLQVLGVFHPAGSPAAKRE